MCYLLSVRSSPPLTFVCFVSPTDACLLCPLCPLSPLPPPPDKHSLTLVAVFQLATALAFSIVVMLGLERAGLGGHMKNEDIVGPLLLPPLHSLLLLQLLLLLRLVFWTVHLA